MQNKDTVFLYNNVDKRAYGPEWKAPDGNSQKLRNYRVTSRVLQSLPTNTLLRAIRALFVPMHDCGESSVELEVFG